MYQVLHVADQTLHDISDVVQFHMINKTYSWTDYRSNKIICGIIFS